MLKLEVSINNIWTIVNYSSSEISIIRKRHDFYENIIRTSCDGDFNFTNCEIWDLLFPFFNTEIQLNGRLTEYDCANNAILYAGFLSINDKIDFATKSFNGSFFIKDKYYSLLDNKKFNEKIRMEGGTGDIIPTKSTQYIYSKLDSHVRVSHNFNINLGLAIDFLMEQIDPLIISNIRNYATFATYYLINSNNWYNNDSFDYEQDIYLSPFYSLSEILETLKNQFFYTWHINDVNELVIEKINNIFKINSTLDLTIFDNHNSQVMTFDKNKISKIQLVSTDIKNNQAYFEKYFNTASIEFDYINTNILSQNNNFETNVNVFGGSKPYLLQCNEASSNVNFENINNKFINYNGEIFYLLGDWTYLHFEGLTAGNKILTNPIQIDNFIKIEFTFTTFFAGYTEGDLSLQFWNGFTYDNYQIKKGYNSFLNVQNSVYNYITIFCNTSYSEKNLIENFNVFCAKDNFLKVVNFFSYGVEIPNFNFSNYEQLKSYVSDMPKSTGVLKLQNGDSENLNNIHTKTDFYKEIQTDLLELSNSYDFNKLVNTKQGWMQIDKLSKTISGTDFELSKKY